MSNYFIHARLATGPYKGKGNDDILIPRIKFLPKDKKMPYEMQRIQFPVRLGFAITHFRSQGQTYKKIGINLTHQIFSHGQLYVGLSRVGSAKSVKIFQPPNDKTKGFMKNVVYHEVLSNDGILPRKCHVDDSHVVVPETKPFYQTPDPGLQRPSYQEQKDLTPTRLEKAGFKLGEYTLEDGSCFLWALLDQMRYNFHFLIKKNLYCNYYSFLHFRIYIRNRLNFFYSFFSSNDSIWKDFGANKTVQQLRKIICDTLYDDVDAQMALLPTEDNMADVDSTGWLENMRKENTWCDNPFMWLAANYFKKEIIVLPIFEDDGHNGTDRITIKPNKPTVGEPFYFLNYSNIHFQSIFPLT